MEKCKPYSGKPYIYYFLQLIFELRYICLIIAFVVFFCHSGTPCTKDDYKEWSPSESSKVNCLLGQKIVYHRRRAHAVCFNGEDFERKISIQNCTCTELDYEW